MSLEHRPHLIDIIGHDAQRERASTLGLLNAAKESFQSQTVFADRIKDTYFAQTKYQRQTAKLSSQELQIKRKRQEAALKGSITRAIRLTERQQQGKSLTYNQQKTVSKTLHLIDSTIRNRPYNSREFDRQYKSTFLRPENDPAPFFRKKVEAPPPPPPEPPKPESIPPPKIEKPVVPKPSPEHQPEPKPSKPLPILDLSQQENALKALKRQIDSVDKKVGQSAVDIANKRRRLQRSDPDFHQSINSAKADLTSEKRRIAQALLQLSQDHQLILPQSAPAPSTFAHKLRTFFRGPSNADISSKIFADFQQGSDLFSDFFTLDNSNPQNIRLIFNPSAAEKFLADHPNQRRQLLLATAAVATTAALKLASETPLGRKVVDQVKKEAVESLDQLQAKFKSWWQEKIAKILRPGEKIAIPGEWLDPYADRFFQAGNEVLNQTATDLYDFFVRRTGFHLDTERKTQAEQPDFPYQDIPPQLVADYLKPENLQRLTDGLIRLYGDGYLVFCDPPPYLMSDIKKRCQSLATTITGLIKQQQFDSKTRVDQINPEYRVKESLLFDNEIAEQLIAYFLKTDSINGLCSWRRNNINQTDVQDRTWYAHQQFLAWRWLEQAYSEASTLGPVNDGSLSIEAANPYAAVSHLLQEYFPSFEDKGSRLAYWLNNQPGAIRYNGSRLSIDSTWLTITANLLTRHQNQEISLDLITGYVDTSKLGDKGLLGQQPEKASTLSNKDSQPSSSSPYPGLLQIVKDNLHSGNIPEAIKQWEEQFTTEVAQRWEILRHLDSQTPSSTEITDNAGVPVFVDHPNGDRRYPVTSDSISPAVIYALLATEDSQFWQHPGVDSKGLARALVGGGEKGGSTITQQLVRILCRTPQEMQQELEHPELRYGRKETEIALALILEKELEAKFTDKNKAKEFILQTFLNNAYFGRHAIGIEAAAREYYGKSAKDLDITEAASLIGLLQQPWGYSQDTSTATSRRNYVLDRVRADGYSAVPSKSLAELKATPLNWKTENYQTPDYFPHFRVQVIDRLRKQGLLGFTNGPVVATIDSKWQEVTEKTLKDAINQYGPQYGFDNGAVIVYDTKENCIKSWVANNHHWDSPSGQVDFVSTPGPPGSTLKPIVVMARYEQGGNPTDVISDAKLTIGDTEITNYGNESYGSLSIEQAIKKSANRVAVRIASKVGLAKFLNRAKILGFDSLQASPISEIHPNIVLGSQPVSLFETANAYTTLARKGKRCQPRLYKDEDCVEQQIVDPEVVDLLLNQTLPSTTSPEKRIVIRYKTGTADGLNGPRGLRLAAISDNLVIVTWLGNSDNSELHPQAVSSKTALPLTQSLVDRLASISA